MLVVPLESGIKNIRYKKWISCRTFNISKVDIDVHEFATFFSFLLKCMSTMGYKHPNLIEYNYHMIPITAIACIVIFLIQFYVCMNFLQDHR